MDISKLRKKIDVCDAKLVAILNDRAKASIGIGKAKNAKNRGIYAPEREREVLEKLKAHNNGPMSNDALVAIWREVMSSSIALEKSLKISHLGQQGSYSYSAALKKFGSQVEYVSSNSLAEVFRRVETGEADYGVVPIENSVEGAVTHTADLLVDSDLQICAQLMIKISHNLLSHAPIDKITKVYSNPQVLAQCRQWILVNLPPDRVKEIGVASTTDASEIAAQDKTAAAIGSKDCARVFSLPVRKENIQDIAHNATRFLVIAQHDVPVTGRDRTSIVFSIKDSVGVLYAMLAPFAKNKINLTRIESRPIKKKAWDYYFFVDLEGHRNDKNVQKALSQLEGMCKTLKILGSYPA